MLDILFIVLGKIVITVSKLFNLGSGSTWPGHIALSYNKNFIRNLLSKNKNLKIILIAGTNGKTTTGKLIRTILEKNNRKVLQNEEGANLLNGIASSFIKYADISGKIRCNYAIFEIDENTFPLILENINPEIIILLNLFRDQLDRYGEVNIVSNKWQSALKKIKPNVSLILNSDDPKIAYLGNKIKNKVEYFGVKGTEQSIDHASDSTYCPKCGNKLSYKSITFSHLGDWTCTSCGLEKPKPDIESFDGYPLPGLYNRYNTHAAILTAKTLGVPTDKIAKALKDFKPAFGRQEIIKYKGKKIQIFLSKNPASFNQSLATINDLKAKNLLVILNDRIPDGRDVSWIWDIDFENNLKNFKSITVSGDRVYDMALRLKYAGKNSLMSNEILSDAIQDSIDHIPENETLYILPTYSAMLDLRKILTGKAIL